MTFLRFCKAYKVEIEHVRMRLVDAFPELETITFDDVATMLYDATEKPVYILPKELWL